MITINIEKAKSIGHDMRRIARSEEFKPFDDIVSKQIPEQVNSAEKARQKIREKYAEVQNLIDSAKNTDEIKDALGI